MGAIVASDVSTSLSPGHTRPVAFVNGYHHAVEVAAIIAPAGAVIAASTLKHARHRPQEQTLADKAFPEIAA